MTLGKKLEALQAKVPLWKVAPILAKLQKNCKCCWVTGKQVKIYEKTVGFKGKHGLAICITYKKEGKDYQCDTLCEDGYIFSFYFSHGKDPQSPNLFGYLNLLSTTWYVIFWCWNCQTIGLMHTWTICSFCAKFTQLCTWLKHCSMESAGSTTPAYFQRLYRAMNKIQVWLTKFRGRYRLWYQLMMITTQTFLPLLCMIRSQLQYCLQ